MGKKNSLFKPVEKFQQNFFLDSSVDYRLAIGYGTYVEQCKRG